MKATDWQAHSVRGFISTLGKKMGLKVDSVARVHNRQIIIPLQVIWEIAGGSTPSAGRVVPLSCLSWKWRERSAVKITEENA